MSVKNKNIQPQPKITGSYKKKWVFREIQLSFCHALVFNLLWLIIANVIS